MKKQSVGRLRRPPQGLSKEAGDCTRKRQGELSEIAFALKAVKLGFRIFQPIGDSRRYDFILDSGQHLWRIQVKSTGGVIGRQANDRGYIINAYWASKGHVPYTADQIDFLVAHVISHDAWYIIPVEAFVPRTCLPLYPAPDSKHVGRYEKYREAWSLLKSNPKPATAKTPR
ncbi:MAG TPA: group I intron-associated PD-(D/E)XK endonuclease [Terriglobales bacterium]|nr:group I intron-associated PD-(D/E)XK endonuclease [Terriglobales bacterium]